MPAITIQPQQFQQWLLVFLMVGIFFQAYFSEFKERSTLNKEALELIEPGYQGFNIVLYKGTFYGWARSLGQIDPSKLDEDQIEQLLALCSQSKQCVSAASLKEAKQLLDSLVPTLVETDKGCNIFAYQNQFYVSCATGNTINEARELINGLTNPR